MTRAASSADYDRVELLVADDVGSIVRNVKVGYEPHTALVYIEGLQPGGYRLMVAGVKGDADKDGVRFASVDNASETWISFPESGVVGSEYFYSSTAFSVWPEDGPGGMVLVSDMPENIVQERIIGRLDVALNFRNQYLEGALKSAVVGLSSPVFYSGLTADGNFAGYCGQGGYDIGPDGGQKLFPDSDCAGRRLWRHGGNSIAHIYRRDCPGGNMPFRWRPSWPIG